MSTRKQREDIAVGDRVWVSSGHSNPRELIQPVARLTKTQIILDGRYTGGADSEFNRYRRGEPYHQLRGGMFSSEITEVATAEECERWDAEQEEKRQREEAERVRRDAVKAKRAELAALFGENAHVEDDERNLAGPWRVTLWLTEEGVRQLAQNTGALAPLHRPRTRTPRVRTL